MTSGVYLGIKEGVELDLHTIKKGCGIGALNGTAQVAKSFNIGGGLSFDGVNDFIQIPHSSAINFNYNDDFTISVIAQIISYSPIWASAMLYAKTVTTSNYTGIQARVGKDIALLSLNSVNNSKRVIFSNKSTNIKRINHFVFINDKNSVYNQKFYVNAIPINSVIRIDNPALGDIRVGTAARLASTSGVDPGYSQIIIYDFKIFNKQLNSNEILKLYKTKCAEVPVSVKTNCVIDYRFDERQGTSLHDKSGSDITATLINFAAGTTIPGLTNTWLDRLGNPITQ